jgi:hypothetical protein
MAWSAARPGDSRLITSRTRCARGAPAGAKKYGATNGGTKAACVAK